MKLTDSFGIRQVAMVAMIAAAALTTSLQAQTHPGRAEVRAIRGSAVFSTPDSPAQPLKVGMSLPSGATVKTAVDSAVDLFLGSSAGVLRVTEQSTLALSTLTITETGADTVVEVQLELPEGTILGNVNKLSAASKYEIKTPNGVAGIRGTRFRCSSSSFILLLDGSLVFVHVPPGGQPTPYTLKAPPAVYFSPLEGVKEAPLELVTTFLNEVEQFDPNTIGSQIQNLVPDPKEDTFVSPVKGSDGK